MQHPSSIFCPRQRFHLEKRFHHLFRAHRLLEITTNLQEKSLFHAFSAKYVLNVIKCQEVSNLAGSTSKTSEKVDRKFVVGL